MFNFQFNVLVSTSVCKEGIDIGSCKLGIEYGRSASSTELTQFIGETFCFVRNVTWITLCDYVTIGRVRAKDGRIFMITREGAEGQVQEFLNGRKTLQHRVAYGLARGPLPEVPAYL